MLSSLVSEREATRLLINARRGDRVALMAIKIAANIIRERDSGRDPYLSLPRADRGASWDLA